MNLKLTSSSSALRIFLATMSHGIMRSGSNILTDLSQFLSVFPLPRLEHLVAPYCAIPRDYLSDTPLLRAMGLLVSQRGQLGAIPPPPFLSVSTLESMQNGGAIPPTLKRGISAIPARYPMKQGKWERYPPSAIPSRKVIARYGGVSRTGPLS